MTTKTTYTPAIRFPDFLNDGEWEVKRLGDCLQYEQPQPYLVATEKYKQTGIPVLTAGKTFILGYTEETFGVYENIPVIIFDDFTTDSKYVDFPFKAKSSAMKMLRAKKGYDLKFLYEIMQMIGFQPQAHQRHWISIYSKIEVAVPSLPEQRRIAACLSALDEMLAATNGKLEQLKAYKKGLMQNLFVSSMGGGKSLNINYLQIPKLRFPEFYDEKEWEEKKLGELTNTFSGGTPTASNKEYYGGDIPFIRSGEINSNSTELFLTQLGLENSAAKLVEKGTILYALYGATSGEVGIAKIGGAINQAILAIIPCEKLDPLFLFFSLQNQKDSIVNQYIQGGQGNLSGSIINSLNFSFPSLPEQRKIASCLSTMDDQINAYTEKVGLLGQYKKGLMQRMFPQNQMN